MARRSRQAGWGEAVADHAPTFITLALCAALIVYSGGLWASLFWLGMVPVLWLVTMAGAYSAGVVEVVVDPFLDRLSRGASTRARDLHRWGRRVGLALKVLAAVLGASTLLSWCSRDIHDWALVTEVRLPVEDPVRGMVVVLVAVSAVALAAAFPLRALRRRYPTREPAPPVEVGVAGAMAGVPIAAPSSSSPNAGVAPGRERLAHLAKEEFWSPSPVIGWRAWEWTGTSLRGFRAAWRSETLVAWCLTCPEVPGEDHGCGIYAVKDPVLLGSVWIPIGSHGSVIGRVELSGLVIEHEHGYRAERARITHLWVSDPEAADAIRLLYPEVDVSEAPPFPRT